MWQQYVGPCRSEDPSAGTQAGNSGTARIGKHNTAVVLAESLLWEVDANHSAQTAILSQSYCLKLGLSPALIFEAAV